MSATPAAKPEVPPLAKLLAPKLYNDISSFEDRILSEFVNQQSDWRGCLPVKEVFLVKQFSKRSEHEYFVAHVKLPDNTSRYISFERNGSRPNYDPPHPLNRLGRWLSRSDTALPAETDRPGHSCAGPSLPIDHNFDGLLLDRNTLSITLNEPTTRQVGPASASSWSSRSSSTGVASLDSLSPPHDALDIVRGQSKPTQNANDVIIGTHCLDSTPVYFHELVVLANTIHNSNSCYQLFSVNCYWFAGMLMNVLEKRVNLGMQQVEIKRKSGKWAFVKVYEQAPPETVETVLAEFEKNLSEFERKINEGRLEEEEKNRRLKEAERGREEAEREREEAERERLAGLERERALDLEKNEKDRRLREAERERDLLREKLALLQRAD